MKRVAKERLAGVKSGSEEASDSGDVRSLTREGTTSLLEALLTVCSLQVSVLAAMIFAMPAIAVRGNHDADTHAVANRNALSVTSFATVLVCLCWLGVSAFLFSLHSAKVEGGRQMIAWYKSFKNLIRATQGIFIAGVGLMTYALLSVSWLVSPSCTLLVFDDCSGYVMYGAMGGIGVACFLVGWFVYDRHVGFTKKREAFSTPLSTPLSSLTSSLSSMAIAGA